MSHGEPEVLFFKYDILSTMEGHRQRASQLVQQTNGNALLNTPTDDLVADILAQVQFEIPVLHRDQARVDQRETQVQVRDYFSHGNDDVRQVQGTTVGLFVPSREIEISSLSDRLPMTPARHVRSWKKTI